MKRGDRINLKDGSVAIITNHGISDFDGDPYPIYYTIISGKLTGEMGCIMSNELKPTNRPNEARDE